MAGHEYGVVFSEQPFSSGQSYAHDFGACRKSSGSSGTPPVPVEVVEEDDVVAPVVVVPPAPPVPVPVSSSLQATSKSGAIARSGVAEIQRRRMVRESITGARGAGAPLLALAPSK